MKRKIVKQAGSAYTITLPIDWIRKNNLSEKSEVEVINKGKRLSILTDSQNKRGTTLIEAKELSKGLQSYHISASYMRGIDEVILKDPRHEPLTDQTMGYAIINQSKKETVIKDIGGTTGDLDEIFKTVFQMIISFHKDAIEDIFEQKRATNKTLQQKDSQINTFSQYLQRAVMKRETASSINTTILFTYAFCLEQIGDEIIRLWRESSDLKTNKELRQINEKTHEALHNAFGAFFQKDKQKMDLLLHTKKKIRSEVDKVITKDNYKNLMRCIKIVELASDLTPLAIMNQLEVQFTN